MMNTQEKSAFALNLVSLRKSRGLSQRDLANLSGISHRMIAYYETQTVIPPIDKLEKLAQALQVSVAALVDAEVSDKSTLKLNTRTLKKVLIMEELPPEDQRKVLDYINALKAQNASKRKN
jgi:transcriptional regulator with XRE-family HTH domain